MNPSNDESKRDPEQQAGTEATAQPDAGAPSAAPADTPAAMETAAATEAPPPPPPPPPYGGAVSGEDPSRSEKKGRWDIVIIIAISLVLLIGMYGWREMSVRMAQDDFSRVQQELEEKAKAERQALTAQSEEVRRQALDRMAQDRVQSLKLLAMPLGWAMRRELLTGNLEQVNAYVGELVRLRGMHSVALADAGGKIIAASDRKLIDQPLSTAFPADVADAKNIVIQPAGGNRYDVGVPVMGLTERLGVVAFRYDYGSGE